MFDKDLNKWARNITLDEGKKISLSIAQVKEVLKIILRDLLEVSFDELLLLMRKAKRYKIWREG